MYELSPGGKEKPMKASKQDININRSVIIFFMKYAISQHKEKVSLLNHIRQRGTHRTLRQKIYIYTKS